jgi:choline dehydrogenase-like flavoprotein
VITHDPVDVCVVGLGAAGGTIAAALAARGVRVVGLEAGPARARAEFTDDEVAHIADRTLLHGEPEVFVLDDGPPMVAPWIARNRGVGGPHAWTGFAYRFNDSDLREWPIGVDELAPWYAAAESQMGVAPAWWDSPGGRRLRAAADELGWRHYRPPAAIDHRCDRCGTCTYYGCHTGAKFSSDRLLDGAAVEVRASATATQVVTEAGGRPRAVQYVDERGHAHEQPARVIVLACNGPYVARLLLLSGLANDADQVGRYAMFHTGAFAYGVFDDILDAADYPAQHVGIDEFVDDRCPVSTRGALLHGGIPAAFTGGPLAFARALGDAIPLPPGVPTYGPGLFDFARDAYRRHLAVYVLGEDLPQYDNRVRLDPDVRDSNGLPALRIEYHPHAEDDAQVAFMLDRAEEWLLRAGAQPVVRAPSRIPGGIFAGHALGMTRMGTDPATSVADDVGRVHGYDNLFVAGGGLFVTSSARNPAVTIVALALRAVATIAAVAHMRR